MNAIYDKTFRGTIKHNGYELAYSMDDFINASDIDTWKHCYLLHDHGYVLAIVFADCEQDALDEAVDCNKLDRYQVSDEEMSDYGDTDEERMEQLSYLGNASEPFDIESLGMFEIAKPVIRFHFE